MIKWIEQHNHWISPNIVGTLPSMEIMVYAYKYVYLINEWLVVVPWHWFILIESV